MFRGHPVDVDDCIAVFATREVDAEELWERYQETASYDVNTERMSKNFIHFVEQLSLRQLVDRDFVERVRSCQ